MLFPFVSGNNLILKIVIENAVLRIFCDEEVSKQLIPNGVSTAMLRFRHAFLPLFKETFVSKKSVSAFRLSFYTAENNKNKKA